MHPESRNYPFGAQRLGFVSGLDNGRPFIDVVDAFHFELVKPNPYRVPDFFPFEGPPDTSRIMSGPITHPGDGGGIDTVGSTTLANVLSMTRYGGAVAACGLAGGMDLPTSVAPFILRGVSLLGIDSVMRPIADRRIAWKRLASELDRGKLSAMTSEIGLAEVIAAARNIVEGRVRGRIVVKIG